jgi:hypothetical protein
MYRESLFLLQPQDKGRLPTVSQQIIDMTLNARDNREVFSHEYIQIWLHFPEEEARFRYLLNRDSTVISTGKYLITTQKNVKRIRCLSNKKRDGRNST